MKEVKESKELVFGLHDGSLFTLGLLSGLTGAGVIMSTAGLVGGVHVLTGSIAIGLVTYTSSQSHKAYRQAIYEFERAEIEEHPAREKERVHEALAKKGLRGKALSVATDEITDEKDHWANFFVEQRFGLANAKERSPITQALIITGSFFLAGIFVLLPFLLLSQPYAIILSVLLALGVTCFAGVQKTRFTHRHPILSGVESAIITALVAVFGFVGGAVLATVF